MSDFGVLYEKLNDAQRQAVDTIDGPVLVIAGPGTGKTQLLSARVANILRQTDTLPQNILCLTFTESGAENMRERLSRFIGKAAYDVGISTYHAFGGDLIKRYGQYFNELRPLTPIDELTKHQILTNIVDRLPYSNPLKQTRHHLGDLIGTISEIKRALLTDKDLESIAASNLVFIREATKITQALLSGFTMPRKLDKALPPFEKLLSELRALPEQSSALPYGSLSDAAIRELEQAINQATDTGKTTPLTKWKNAWLIKDENNQFILDGQLENQRIGALAGVFRSYQKVLDERALYDFDDMIIRAITTLQDNSDLKYTLQEQYQYVLLDEFQDTNAAQLKLIELLTDNPVHEGRPNVLAVGDDDQAIYAFQGAQYSNMLDFFNLYNDVAVINLAANYRSHAHILHAAGGVADQIEARLHHQLGNLTKTLNAANSSLPEKAYIMRTECLSDVAQHHWIATRIKELIDQGVEPKEIAVLAPKHKQLEPIVPYLNALGVPVRYERRENILEAAIIKQLLAMCKLVLALSDDNTAVANALWPEVLSFDFWQLPVSSIWQIAWDIKAGNTDGPSSWNQALLNHKDTRPIALLFLALAHRVSLETCEAILDFLIGSDDVKTHEADIPEVRSPLREYYTNSLSATTHPEPFYETLSQLKVLRTRLREYQATNEKTLGLRDLLEFIRMYEEAGQQMTNTSPYNQQANAVQLMTVFKSKGLEFEHVFLPSCLDDVWGSSSRGNSNKLTLPHNLSPIRHAGTTEDERLRLLFVALTRARIGLYMASFGQTYAGKPTKRLKYLSEQEQTDGTYKSLILAEPYQLITHDSLEAPTLELLEHDWRTKHHSNLIDTTLRSLLDFRLKSYKLSPTHVTSFTDTIYDGPEQFFFKTLLRFPRAPSVDSQYGDAIHATLEWVQQQVNAKGELPPLKSTLDFFSNQMKHKHLTEEQCALEIERGHSALATYLKKRGHTFHPGDLPEHSFRHEHVALGDVLMNGTIDRLEVDKEHKTITVIDYKTGKSFSKWTSDARLHKYKRQLYCYKLLIEHSQTFKDYVVTSGRLEFVTPDYEGPINSLELEFTETELERTKALTIAVWKHIMDLSFPDISSYSSDLKGILAFEDDLLDGKI
jgi:DNA helicase-2/ATP-dependent DNA helicase PcrA